jgi:Outer membrane protein beta-barrel domain
MRFSAGVGLAASVLAAGLMGASDARAAHLALEVSGGYADLSGISRTADASFGSHGGFAFGGALRVDLGPRWFVRAGADHLKKSGQRVFVADANGPVFGSGFPLDFSLTPAYGDLGFRFLSGGPFRAYLGAGAGMAWTKATSDVAGEIDETNARKFSARALLGASYGRGHVQIGAEFAYATIPNAAGIVDVSAIYGEKNLGGFSATAILTLRP